MSKLFRFRWKQTHEGWQSRVWNTRKRAKLVPNRFCQLNVFFPLPPPLLLLYNYSSHLSGKNNTKQSSERNWQLYAMNSTHCTLFCCLCFLDQDGHWRDLSVHKRNSIDLQKTVLVPFVPFIWNIFKFRQLATSHCLLRGNSNITCIQHTDIGKLKSPSSKQWPWLSAFILWDTGTPGFSKAGHPSGRCATHLYRW